MHKSILYFFFRYIFQKIHNDDPILLYIHYNLYNEASVIARWLVFRDGPRPKNCACGKTPQSLRTTAIIRTTCMYTTDWRKLPVRRLLGKAIGREATVCTL